MAMARLTIREIPGAYVGKHVEVVDDLGARIYPPVESSKIHRPPDDREHPVLLGCARGEAEAFIAGYVVAIAEALEALDSIAEQQGVVARAQVHALLRERTRA